MEIFTRSAALFVAQSIGFRIHEDDRYDANALKIDANSEVTFEKMSIYLVDLYPCRSRGTD